MSKKRKKERQEKRSVATATRKKRELDSRKGSQFLALPEGVNQFAIKAAKPTRIDIIPYTVGKGNPRADEGEFYWERTFYIHRGIGANQDWIICPSRTAKQPCPICEYIAKLQKDPNADEDVIKALSPSRRMILNVIDMDAGDKAVKIWETSHAYFGKALNEALEAEYEDDENNMDGFCDPNDGHYLKLSVETGWQGKGFSVERVDFKPRREDLDEDILGQAVCLDDILVIKDYDELKKMLMEEDDSYDTKSKKSKKSSKKKVEEDDDFDDEDEEEEDEEEEDEEEDEGEDSEEDDDFDDDKEDEEDEVFEDDNDDETSKKSKKSSKAKTSKPLKKAPKGKPRSKK